jgi:methionine-rich copper-binding protein CopC
MIRRAVAATAGLAAAVALALLPAVAASAHDYLVGSDPAADSTVTTPPTAVTLTFNDRVLDLAGDGSSTLLTVTGPDAGTRHFETGCATVADLAVSAPVALGTAGSYTVTYQVVSADGHTVSNSYRFAYQPPAGAVAAAGSESTPCRAPAPSPTAPSPTASGPATAAATPGGSEPLLTASTPQPTQAADDSGLGLVIGIAVAIVVLALAGVVIVILTARRRPPGEPGVGHEPAPDGSASDGTASDGPVPDGSVPDGSASPAEGDDTAK